MADDSGELRIKRPQEYATSKEPRMRPLTTWDHQHAKERAEREADAAKWIAKVKRRKAAKARG